VREVATVDVAAVDTSNFKDIAIEEAMQGIDFAEGNGFLVGAASVLVRRHSLH
jgi:hypothetical protein